MLEMGIHPVLGRAHHVPLAAVTIYVLLLTLLTIPWIQREFVFLHHARWPLFAKYDNPERYGLAPYKTANFRIDSGNESLGAWHVLPQSVYAAQGSFPPTSPLSEKVYEEALLTRPTILYFHGNAAGRAAPHRVRSYSAFSSILDLNVIAVDYRGFADSTGSPSEAGLLTDARTTFDLIYTKLRKRGISNPADQIILAGQSLGTGVVSGLAGQLAQDGIRPRAIVLIAPFSSISELVLTFRLFRAIPVLSPLRSLPSIQKWLVGTLLDRFDSKTALTNTTASTLILHAQNDETIPPTHSSTLFTHLHDLAGFPQINVHEIPNWGTISSFQRPFSAEKGGSSPVVYWDGLQGGHNNLGWAEGTIELIRQIARL